MIIRNLTPHAITLCGVELESSGLARCARQSRQIGEIDGIPVNTTVFAEVSGLPSPEQGTIYVVSRIVAEACKGTRDDLYIVDETVRDAEGRIVGANALATV